MTSLAVAGVDNVRRSSFYSSRWGRCLIGLLVVI
jgi:hypothetical protein